MLRFMDSPVTVVKGAAIGEGYAVSWQLDLGEMEIDTESQADAGSQIISLSLKGRGSPTGLKNYPRNHIGFVFPADSPGKPETYRCLHKCTCQPNFLCHDVRQGAIKKLKYVNAVTFAFRNARLHELLPRNSTPGCASAAKLVSFSRFTTHCDAQLLTTIYPNCKSPHFIMAANGFVWCLPDAVSHEKFVDVKHSDVVFIFLEEEKVQVFLNELTKVIPTFVMHPALTKCRVLADAVYMEALIHRQHLTAQCAKCLRNVLGLQKAFVSMKVMYLVVYGVRNLSPVQSRRRQHSRMFGKVQGAEFMTHRNETCGVTSVITRESLVSSKRAPKVTHRKLHTEPKMQVCTGYLKVERVDSRSFGIIRINVAKSRTILGAAIQLAVGIRLLDPQLFFQKILVRIVNLNLACEMLLSEALEDATTKNAATTKVDKGRSSLNDYLAPSIPAPLAEKRFIQLSDAPIETAQGVSSGRARIPNEQANDDQQTGKFLVHLVGHADRERLGCPHEHKRKETAAKRATYGSPNQKTAGWLQGAVLCENEPHGSTAKRKTSWGLTLTSSNRAKMPKKPNRRQALLKEPQVVVVEILVHAEEPSSPKVLLNGGPARRMKWTFCGGSDQNRSTERLDSTYRCRHQISRRTATVSPGFGHHQRRTPMVSCESLEGFRSGCLFYGTHIFPVTTLSVGEILRGISVATNRDVAADVLNKPEKMDEIMWQLITIYFDMPPTQFIPAFMLKLMNRIVSELQFPQLFSFSDLNESRDRKKWIDFFSCILCFLQFKSHFKVADEIYKGAISRKNRYSELCNLVSKREDEFTTRQAEIMALQEAIRKVKIHCEEATSRYRKLDNEHSGLRQQVSSMQDDLSRRVENTCVSDESVTHRRTIEAGGLVTTGTDKLRLENTELEAECEKSSKNILENVDSLTRFIPKIKAQLDEVEVEMHALFERRTNLFERTTEFHHYEALLDKLNLGDFYVLLDRYASLKQQVKMTSTANLRTFSRRIKVTCITVPVGEFKVHTGRLIDSEHRLGEEFRIPAPRRANDGPFQQMFADRNLPIANINFGYKKTYYVTQRPLNRKEPCALLDRITLQQQYDETTSELEAKRIEKENLSRSLSEMQNDMMRQKLLLAKKKKAIQANSKCGAKDLAALEREAAELQETVNKSQRTLTLTEEQIKLGHAENDRFLQYERNLQLPVHQRATPMQRLFIFYHFLHHFMHPFADRPLYQQSVVKFFHGLHSVSNPDVHSSLKLLIQPLVWSNMNKDTLMDKNFNVFNVNVQRYFAKDTSRILYASNKPAEVSRTGNLSRSLLPLIVGNHWGGIAPKDALHGVMNYDPNFGHFKQSTSYETPNIQSILGRMYCTPVTVLPAHSNKLPRSAQETYQFPPTLTLLLPLDTGLFSMRRFLFSRDFVRNRNKKFKNFSSTFSNANCRSLLPCKVPSGGLRAENRTSVHRNTSPRIPSTKSYKQSQSIRKLTSLKVIYLHGNQIKCFQDVQRLCDLAELRKLTLHGNPVEKEKHYFCIVVAMLPNLISLDFTGISKADYEATIYTEGKMHFQVRITRELPYERRPQSFLMAYDRLAPMFEHDHPTGMSNFAKAGRKNTRMHRSERGNKVLKTQTGDKHDEQTHSTRVTRSTIVACTDLLTVVSLGNAKTTTPTRESPVLPRVAGDFAPNIVKLEFDRQRKTEALNKAFIVVGLFADLGNLMVKISPPIEVTPTVRLLIITLIRAELK
ncbi:leucine-rich repeat-containing protein 51 [Clonorchis sinensis]|uniref:Leucine-rich repeat-containing protein 51 n=1 Tax=Clonorchis sinensis TaxID=79923 RepID=G7YAZ0_CLOSI|nr:leucine-rich repeat-containing protein 51 [Clonorchis sinensis]